MPLVGLLLLPLVPQPALTFGLKYGRAGSVWLVLLATIILFLLGGQELALAYSLLALMTTLLLFSFGKGWRIESVVVGTAGGMLAVVSAVLLSLFGSLAHLRQVIGGVLQENLEASLRAYEKVGFSGESLQILRERVPQMIEITVQILPALAFATLISVILINLFLLYRRFPDHRSLFVSDGDLREWKTPEPLIWGFILLGFSLFLPGWDMLRTLALNLFLVTAFFYFFQGMAIIAYYFHHKNIPLFLRGLAYVLIAFEQIFTIFVVGLGLFDLWGDFRRLNKKDLNPDSVS